MIPPAGLSRREFRFIACIVAFWIVSYATVLILALLGDIHAIRIYGIALAFIGIPLGLATIDRLLSQPPFAARKPPG